MICTKKFYAISVLSNPIRYSTRWRLYKQFQQHMKDLNVKLITVEQAFGRRDFQVTERDDPMHVQVRSDQEVWHKENMVNIAIGYLTQIDPDWQYVAWIDGDIHFNRHDIITETAHQLQHFDIVQMFSHVVDLGPEQEPIQQHNGFMWSYIKNGTLPPIGPGNGGYYGAHKTAFWHPGYAWAARREAIEKLPLLDTAILGAADHHMALSLIGQGWRSIPGGVTKEYRESILNWENMARKLYRNVGYVPGLITHHWHGKKKNRKYIERWKILVDNKFNPYTDITRDAQGLWRLNEHHNERYMRLRDDMRAYFRSRNEDGIDYEPDDH